RRHRLLLRGEPRPAPGGIHRAAATARGPDPAGDGAPAPRRRQLRAGAPQGDAPPHRAAGPRPGAVRAAEARIRAPIRLVDPPGRDRRRGPHAADSGGGARRRTAARSGGAALGSVPRRRVEALLVPGLGGVRAGPVVPAPRSAGVTLPRWPLLARGGLLVG